MGSRASKGTGSVLATATADNGTATATVAAGGTGSSIYITGISMSYSATPAAAKLAQLKFGTSVVATFHLATPRDIVFDPPLAVTQATACSVELAASGTGGVTGAANIFGYRA